MFKYFAARTVVEIQCLETVLGVYNFAFIVSQVFILDPELDNLISWARSNERNSYKKANSTVEYFRLMSLNIYKNHMKLEDKRAKGRAFQARKAVSARNTQRNHMLKEQLQPNKC